MKNKEKQCNLDYYNGFWVGVLKFISNGQTLNLSHIPTQGFLWPLSLWMRTSKFRKCPQKFKGLSYEVFSNFWLANPYSCVTFKFTRSWRKRQKNCLENDWIPTLSVMLLTLSQTTNFRLFQTERVCRRQFQTWQKWRKVLQMSGKHCGKRRNCSLRAISPFRTVFSKGLYCRHVKTRACLGKG